MEIYLGLLVLIFIVAILVKWGLDNRRRERQAVDSLRLQVKERQRNFTE
jgi:hypothetical protein